MGQTDRKLSARAHRTADRNVSAVGFHHLTHETQSQTEATGTATATAGGSGGALVLAEDEGKVAGSDALTFIGNTDEGGGRG